MTGIGSIDLYVWAYDAATDNPGTVLAVATSVLVSGVGLWPSITTHDLEVADAPVSPHGVFVGYWPRSFFEAPPAFGCAMDRNGPGGVPRTNVAPGIGYPTGWAHPATVGYPMQAWGLGPWVSGGGTPVTPGSWGSVKALCD